MNVFEIHSKIISDYKSYIQSFLNISDTEIQKVVESELAKGKLWPAPLLQFNPSYKMYGTVKEVVSEGLLHPSAADTFKGFNFYFHQIDAIKLGTSAIDFVVTSGTGSGKSLTYMATIFDYLFKNPTSKGVTAVIVYPMNALINSQMEEFDRYKEQYEQSTGKEFPISIGQYTGQEKEEVRVKMQENPPQILLTNYMMLELLLTRVRERSIRTGIFENLRFLIFDELHTYRGRQGADVSILVRRVRSQCVNNVTCIGTSATMVSVGDLDSQMKEVAGVATKIFGKKFNTNQIVNEKLDRSLEFAGKLHGKNQLKKAVLDDIEMSDDVEKLKVHPLAIWLENRIALQTVNGILVRGKPMQMEKIAAQLSEDSDETALLCREKLEKLLQWISLVNKKLQASNQRYTILPYKLHQFISQSGSVYTTLDQDQNRFVTLEPGVYKKEDEDKKPIFPNVFSRLSGFPFLCVSWSGDKLEPREFKDISADDEDASDGYLVIGDDVWNPAEDLELLPDNWVRKTKAGISPKLDKKPFLPQKIYFDEFGNCSETEPKKWWGWFIKAPMLFDPTAGMVHDGKTNENTKLMKLGNEGRSTSTTITAFSILSRLSDAGFSDSDQKLLSFTDNRQDAALQAGHFNDFAQVVRLRAAIQKALLIAPNQSLIYSTLGEAIYKSLALPFLDFANRNDDQMPSVIKARYEQCFQKFLFYRAIEDLRRSWRIILPNLEQCALLDIDYQDLNDISTDDDFWKDTPIIWVLDHVERKEFLRIILDFFRLEFAIHSENFLTQSRIKENEKEFRETLKLPWSLESDGELREPNYIRFEPLHRNAGFYNKSMGPASALGKFIKFYVRKNDLGVDLKGDHYRDVVEKIVARLEQADYLISKTAKNQDNFDTKVYQLRLEKIIWKYGDGNNVKPDVIKQRSYKDQKPKPNEFFKTLYQRDFSKVKKMQGEDHTGQLNTDTRIDREEKFRSGEISALFCSPTMELGIDIKNLSVVHMRNAPPNASNYVQRSGRAGRSGQAALVFTYCSSYSPHDRHYFQEQESMVAGSVVAPKFDLCNQELLRSHLNAVVASTVGLPGLEAGNGGRASIMNFIDENDDLSLSQEVKSGLVLSPTTFNELKASFKRVIYDFENELLSKTSNWYSDQWIENNLANLTHNLDESLKRWRSLYRSARATLSRATQKIDSAVLGAGSPEYRKQKRNQDQATHQLELLRNDLQGKLSELSEFYPYRYLASEGFLPGYNFTRLPLRVYLPTGDTTGEFISRPRNIALKEFGPLNIIYHNGRKYRVEQLVIQEAESNLTEAKLSKKSGYLLEGDQRSLEICPFSGVNLGDNANKEHLHDLIEMSESRAKEIDRISCEEEERRSRGFDVKTFFTIDGGDFSRIRKAIAKSNENNFLNLRYIPAARLVNINYQWRSKKTAGFPMGMISGDWKDAMPVSEPNAPIAREEFKLVKLRTSNLADALYIEPIQPLGLNADGVITLQYALKRAIESIFQVESNEIGVVIMGDPETPNILLYESSEGSLGILSQFVDDITVFRKVIEQAIRLCRFDDEKYKGPASYDDLLGYFNQRDHKVIDRHLIKDALDKLLLAEIEIQTNPQFKDYETQYQTLLRGLDPTSSTERKFLDYLYKNGLRLPDAAQKRVEGLYIQPDFYYEARIWIFCDGTPHDEFKVQEDDATKRQELIARGDEVWVYYYKDDLAAIVAARPDIFRKVK